MSHFYGTLCGSRGEATRCGTKRSGLTTYTASWSGAIRVRVWHDSEIDCDRYVIEQATWRGAGIDQAIAQGILGLAS